MCLWASSLASLGIYFLATTFSQLQIGIILTASRRWFFQSLILAHGLCSQSIIIMIIITIIHCGKEWQAYIRKALLSPCPILHCFYPWLCIYSWRKPESLRVWYPFWFGGSSHHPCLELSCISWLPGWCPSMQTTPISFCLIFPTDNKWKTSPLLAAILGNYP